MVETIGPLLNSSSSCCECLVIYKTIAVIASGLKLLAEAFLSFGHWREAIRAVYASGILPSLSMLGATSRLLMQLGAK